MDCARLCCSSVPRFDVISQCDKLTERQTDGRSAAAAQSKCQCKHRHTRDGPKFGERRSSAEEFGRMFGSVRLGNMWLFGRSSAELRQKFGVTFATFCARRSH